MTCSRSRGGLAGRQPRSSRSSSPILIIDYAILFVMTDTTETKMISQPRPKETLTEKEAEILQLVDRRELPCPRCGQSLYGQKLIEVGIYEDVVLVCLEGCDWREF